MKPVRVLVVLNSICLYGMERTVLEVFDLVRPEIEPHFLIPLANQRYDRLLLAAIQQRGFAYSFHSDDKDWPLLGAIALRRQPGLFMEALTRANLDVLRAARQADAIYLPNISAAYIAVAARLGARRPTLFHFHDISNQPSVKYRLVDRLTDAYVHYTRTSYEIAARANPVIQAKMNYVAAVYNEYRAYAPDAAVDQQLRQGRNIVFAGQIARHKGADLLLQAFGQLHARFPDARLHILGTPAAEFESELDHWRSTSSAAGATHLWGYREDVYRFLEAAFVYVHPTPPSRFLESLGRGIVEAMACGVPAVCFASGAMAETVVAEGSSPDATGIVCLDETPQAIAQALERLFSDDGTLRRRLSVNSRRRYDAEYCSAQVKQQWIDIFRGLTG